MAFAKALKSELTKAPDPLVDIRDKDYIFTYLDKTLNKEIIVIIDKDGGITATVH